MAEDTESLILAAGLRVLESGGPGALTTRAVCEAAGVTAPTLYHHFGDKGGLASALVQRGLAEFMRRKQQPPATADPLEQLRAGWDLVIDFALKNPELHALFVEHARSHPQLLDGPYETMLARVQRLVDMGRFRGPVDEAARTVWAASNGALSLLLRGASRKQVESASRTLFDAVVRALSSPPT